MRARWRPRNESRRGAQAATSDIARFHCPCKHPQVGFIVGVRHPTVAARGGVEIAFIESTHRQDQRLPTVRACRTRSRHGSSKGEG